MCHLRKVSFCSSQSGKVVLIATLNPRPVQDGVGKWKDRIAIRSRGSEDLAKTDSSFIIDSLAPYLCYVCHTTFTSRGARAPGALYPGETDFPPTLTPLPTWATSSRKLGTWLGSSVEDTEPEADEADFTIARKLDRKEMRDSVKDFLLDDDES